MSATITVPTKLQKKIVKRATTEGKGFEQLAIESLEKTFDHLEAIEAIHEGLESVRLGTGTPAREFFAALRQEQGIPERQS